MASNESARNPNRVRSLDDDDRADEAKDHQQRSSKKKLSKGCTHLMYNCQQGNTADIVQELCSGKPKTILRRDHNNKNALHYCSGQKDLVAAASVALAAPELLESADEDGFTPLHLAVIQGNMPLVNMLLAGKADVNALDHEGHSVVHWATVCGEVETLRTVLAAGADISTRDINGGSPLHYAAQMCGGNYDAKSGPISTAVAMEILNIILRHPKSDVNVVDKDDRQPLLWAASAGSSKALVALIKAGAKVESSDKDGLTAIHCAASRGHTECIDTLISLCGAPTDLIDTNGCTALHYAVTLGHADAVALLLDLEADPNRQDRKGRTPAHCGCAKGQFETVKMLKDRGGANMWLRNAKGDLPIHEAALSGRRELVQWLLEQRPKQVNITSNDGRTILHIAADKDSTDMCKMLIDYGADINSIYRTPRNVVMTPLDCALLKGQRSTAKFLQLHGGLPAGKLRLSGRNPNAINDQELVKPLHSSSKPSAKEEITQKSDKPLGTKTKHSKKIIVYVDRSNSETTSCEDHTQCHRTTIKCEDHHHHHRSNHDEAKGQVSVRRRRHRQSRCRHYRASSCETLVQANSSGDIHRSKSNIELHRRRKSQSKSKRKDTPCESSSSTDSSDSECLDCRQRRREKYKSQRRRRARSTPRKKRQIQEQSVDIKQFTKRDDSSSAEEHGRRSTTKTYQKETTTTTKTEIVKTKNVQDSQTNEEGGHDEMAERMEEKEKGMKSRTQEEPNEQETQPSNIVDNKENVETVETVTEVKTTESVDVKGIDTEIVPLQPEPTSEPARLSISVLPPTPTPSEDSIIASSLIVTKADVHTPHTDSSPEHKVIEKKIDLIDDHLTDSTFTMEQPIQPTSVPDTNQEPQNASLENTAVNNELNSFEKPTPESPLEDPTKDDYAGREEVQEEPCLKIDVNADQDYLPTPEPVPSSLSPLPSPHLESAARTPEENMPRKTSFTVLASDESLDHQTVDFDGHFQNDSVDEPSFQVLNSEDKHSDDDNTSNDDDGEDHFQARRPVSRSVSAGGGISSANGRRKRMTKRMKAKGPDADQQNRDHDSGFEPSPRAIRTKIPSPQTTFSAVVQSRRAVIDRRTFSGRVAGRKPGDRNAVDMETVTRSLRMNIRRYYMERKIFQHLLELKSLQIRSSKLNEAVLVKRAVDDYHKSTLTLGAGCVKTGDTTGSDGGPAATIGIGSPAFVPLRRYSYKEYTFKNFEIFLYESLKSLQRSGTYNFQNISDVYKEAERRLSPHYGRSEKALQCTTKTHRCLHAAHAYTGIPCAAYIPMMNHHTMPKPGFGPLKSAGLGSFYLPKIPSGSRAKTASKNTAAASSSSNVGPDSATGNNNRVSLELSHGNNRQLIALPANKLDSNKRYYVTFTVKGNEGHKAHQKDEHQ